MCVCVFVIVLYMMHSAMCSSCHMCCVCISADCTFSRSIILFLSFSLSLSPLSRHFSSQYAHYSFVSFRFVLCFIFVYRWAKYFNLLSLTLLLLVGCSGARSMFTAIRMYKCKQKMCPSRSVKMYDAIHTHKIHTRTRAQTWIGGYSFDSLGIFCFFVNLVVGKNGEKNERDFNKWINEREGISWAALLGCLYSLQFDFALFLSSSASSVFGRGNICCWQCWNV